MHRPRLTRAHAVRGLSAAALALVALAPAATGSGERSGAADLWAGAPTPTAVVGYRTRPDLTRALRAHPGVVLRTIPALGVAEVLPRTPARYFAQAASREGGIRYVEPPVARTGDAEPALQPTQSSLPGGILEWQYPATHMDAVPDAVKRAAAAVTIAVIDTGADLTAPDIAAKTPVVYSVVGSERDVRDAVGHGTFVAALAAGSDTNGEGIAGFGGSAKLMVVQASRSQTTFTDFDEAAAIVWAVDHGARILNLSLGGADTSTTERKAIAYAVDHGALVVAAVGNAFEESNPVEYPAALVQPVGSNGRGGTGLAVGASDDTGGRAPFSGTGSHLSLVAPGAQVLSAISSTGRDEGYVEVPVPGSAAGLYAFGSGTSFAAPEVAGAAALVWAASPGLSAQQVAEILKRTASNHGVWNDQTGFGVLDAAAAVQAASSAPLRSSAASRPAVPAAALRLAVTPPKGRAPLRLSVRVTLTAGGGTKLGGRRVALESYTAGRWQESAAKTTGAAGRASWRFSLGTGVYRVRARFAGAADLRAAVSRPASVRVS